MNAGEALARAVVDAIGAGDLRVFDAAPMRAAVPHAVVEPPTLRSWNAAGWDGREGRVAVNIHDEGERPDRLWRLIDTVEAAMAATMPDLNGGWRLIAGQVATARVRRAEGTRWTATVEMRVRLYRTQ